MKTAIMVIGGLVVAAFILNDFISLLNFRRKQSRRRQATQEWQALLTKINASRGLENPLPPPIKIGKTRSYIIPASYSDRIH